MNKQASPVKQKVRPPAFIANHGSFRPNIFPGKKGYRVAARDRRERLIWFVWSVLFIWSVSFNPPNQIDQINKRNQPAHALHASRSIAAGGLFQHPANTIRLRILFSAGYESQ